MKHRAALTLMELLIMAAVFSLAAAICLQGFAQAHWISQESAHRAQAALIAQNAAEQIKAAGTAEPTSTICNSDGQPSPEGAYRLEIQPLPAEIPGLGEALVQVLSEEHGECLFSIPVCWQEVEE